MGQSRGLGQVSATRDPALAPGEMSSDTEGTSQALGFGKPHYWPTSSSLQALLEEETAASEGLATRKAGRHADPDEWGEETLTYRTSSLLLLKVQLHQYPKRWLFTYSSHCLLISQVRQDLAHFQFPLTGQLERIPYVFLHLSG